jgi:hypothetical protein
MPYGKNKVLLGVSNSTLTSAPQLVDGYRQLSISITSAGTIAGDVLVYGSNINGFDAALPSSLSFSLVTTISSQGIYTVDPGMRWLLVERENTLAGSALSNATIMLQANVT